MKRMKDRSLDKVYFIWQDYFEGRASSWSRPAFTQHREDLSSCWDSSVLWLWISQLTVMGCIVHALQSRNSNNAMQSALVLYWSVAQRLFCFGRNNINTDEYIHIFMIKMKILVIFFFNQTLYVTLVCTHSTLESVHTIHRRSTTYNCKKIY